VNDMPEKSYFIEGSIKPQFIAEQIAKHNTKHNIGAHSIFLGQVRADEIDNKKVMGIEYSTYEDMANKEIAKVRESAFVKWPLSCLHIYHSNGPVKTGEISLFIFVSAGHRTECLEAVHQIVEDIKHKVPIWKKEIMEDGSGRWVK
jgi:molybdopterin synthase catalytic subunit